MANFHTIEILICLVLQKIKLDIPIPTCQRTILMGITSRRSPRERLTDPHECPKYRKYTQYPQYPNINILSILISLMSWCLKLC